MLMIFSKCFVLQDLMSLFSIDIFQAAINKARAFLIWGFLIDIGENFKKKSVHRALKDLIFVPCVRKN